MPATRGDYAKAFLVVWLPPVLLLLSSLTSADLFVALFALAQAGLLLVALALATLNWRTQRVSVAELAFIAYVLVLLLCTLLALPRYPELSDAPLLRPLFLFFLWCAPVFVVPALFTSAGSLHALLRMLDLLGFMLVLTVALPALGLEFGEVQQTASTGMRRVFGPYGDSIGPVLAFFLLGATATRSYWRMAVYSGGLLLTVGLGAITLSLVAFFALALRLGTGARLSLRRLAGIAATAVALVPVIFLAGGDVFLRLTNPQAMAFTLAERAGSLLSAIQVFQDHVWFGVGYSALKVITYRYRPEDLFASFAPGAVSTAANQVLQTATDAGVFGLLMLAVLFWTSLRVLGAAATRESGRRFAGMWAWAVGLIFGFQSAVWLLPHLLIPFLFFLSVGTAVAWMRVHPVADVLAQAPAEGASRI